MRGYYVHNDDEDQAPLAVVADTAKAAKSIGYHYGWFISGDTRWIAITAHWIRDADVSGLPVGAVRDDRDALIRGFFCALLDYPCDECKKKSRVECYGERVLCSDCLEKEYLHADTTNV